MSDFLKSSFLRPSLLALSAVLSLSLSGCGIGPVTASNSTDTITGPIAGIIHGGPNPVVGAEVILYATTSTGYGVGTQLQEATQVGASAHQDTSSTGNFNFAGGITCPAGAYAYVVAYGGNSGAGNNPNSVLMAALGACSTLFSGTTYTGNVIWVDELTTVAAGYALSNFIGITGTAIGGYTVGIGADSTNAAATGCVNNAYYGLVTCPTTTAAGLAHAFANAATLVSTTNGQANATTTTSAVIPNRLINTLGNVLQACVNSTGGGTSASTGLPTTATSAGGTTYDGTNCGALSAFTSYTRNGTPTGTLVAAGNTLGFVQNLAKRPGGSSSTFNSACASGSTGTTTAATCILNLGTPAVYYTPVMSAAPPDWSISIQWPKGSFSNATNSTTCVTSSVPATNGLLYPYMLATDINDNLAIVNGDGSANVCMNIITIGFDGTLIGANAFDGTSTQLNSIAMDDFGHAIVPVHGAGGTSNPNNGVRIYAAGTGDSSPTLITTYEYLSTAATAAEDLPYFVAVDSNDTIWIGNEGGVNGFGWLTLNGTPNSHLTPVYTAGAITTPNTGKSESASIDINNNFFTATSSSSNTSRPYTIKATSSTALVSSPPASATEAAATDEASGVTSVTSNGFMVLPDTNGNIWQVDTSNATDVQGTPIQDVVYSMPYTSSTDVIGTPSTTYLGGTTYLDYKVEPGTIDGNNVIWWGDLQGTSNAPTGPIYSAWIHGFDTVNQTYLPTVNGCVFNPAGSYAITAWSITSGTGTTFTTSATPPSVNGVVTLSGFGTSTFFNGTQVTVTANVTTSPYSFTVTNTFSQATSSNTESGTASGAAGTQCGSNSGDYNFPSNVYPFYGTRGLAVDSAGDIWTANGTQGKITEVIGIAAPTWPLFIHNGSSNKP